ncbi:MAG TPA: GNAT family N-acetyltransferase [Acidimicrobiales bacterium]|nr:GNAT family N-acetyltransferase [Acidimicrobiales bacterium]
MSLDGALGPEAAEAVASLCLRGLGPACPEPRDLAAGLFGTAEPVVVRGDPAVGVVATARRRGAGYIRLLVVDPDRRRQGVGHQLITLAEADLDGCGTITAGADAPDYLFPGVDPSLTPMLCLLEARGYRHTGANLNMDVDLDALGGRPPEGAVRLAGPPERAEVEAFMAQHWPNWADEALRGLDRQRLLLAHDDEGIAGFCAWDVNRAGWLGPIGVRPGLYGRGTGVPLLMEALHRMRDEGRHRAEVAWISPIRFYVRNAGARMGTVYLVFEKRRAR